MNKHIHMKNLAVSIYFNDEVWIPRNYILGYTKCTNGIIYDRGIDTFIVPKVLKLKTSPFNLRRILERFESSIDHFYVHTSENKLKFNKAFVSIYARKRPVELMNIIRLVMRKTDGKKGEIKVKLDAKSIV